MRRPATGRRELERSLLQPPDMNTRTQPTIPFALALFALAACGGPVDTEVANTSDEATLANRNTIDAGGNCSNVCTEVLACCVCKCHEDSSAPFSYLCAAGCLVLDTTIGNDDEEGDVFVFTSDAGDRQRDQQYVALASNRRRVTVEVAFLDREARQFEPRAGAQVTFATIAVDDYMEAIELGRAPAFAPIGAGQDTGRGSFGATLDARALPAGPYFVQASSVDGRGRRANAMVMLEVQ